MRTECRASFMEENFLRFISLISLPSTQEHFQQLVLHAKVV